jgi:hypothetical protein
VTRPIVGAAVRPEPAITYEVIPLDHFASSSLLGGSLIAGTGWHRLTLGRSGRGGV